MLQISKECHCIYEERERENTMVHYYRHESCPCPACFVEKIPTQHHLSCLSPHLLGFLRVRLADVLRGTDSQPVIRVGNMGTTSC